MDQFWAVFRIQSPQRGSAPCSTMIKKRISQKRRIQKEGKGEKGGKTVRQKQSTAQEVLPSQTRKRAKVLRRGSRWAGRGISRGLNQTHKNKRRLSKITHCARSAIFDQRGRKRAKVPSEGTRKGRRATVPTRRCPPGSCTAPRNGSALPTPC